jgi:hypothetical protein
MVLIWCQAACPGFGTEDIVTDARASLGRVFACYGRPRPARALIGRPGQGLSSPRCPSRRPHEGVAADGFASQGPSSSSSGHLQSVDRFYFCGWFRPFGPEAVPRRPQARREADLRDKLLLGLRVFVQGSVRSKANDFARYLIRTYHLLPTRANCRVSLRRTID